MIPLPQVSKVVKLLAGRMVGAGLRIQRNGEVAFNGNRVSVLQNGKF